MTVSDQQIRDEHALLAGIAVGSLTRHHDAQSVKSLKAILDMPGVKAIARANPKRILAGIYDAMGVSYEE